MLEITKMEIFWLPSKNKMILVLKTISINRGSELYQKHNINVKNALQEITNDQNLLLKRVINIDFLKTKV